MRNVLVRYRVKPELVEENEQLVRDVYAELARARPDGLRYAADNPLLRTEAFQRFVAGIGDRCDEPPTTAVLEQIGSYHFGDGSAKAPAP
jgi:hypothetical protein